MKRLIVGVAIVIIVMVFGAVLFFSQNHFTGVGSRQMQYSLSSQALILINEADMDELKLFNSKYHIDKKPINGHYVLVDALKLQKTFVVTRLIDDEKYDLNVTDDLGRTPLNCAISNCSVPMLQTLINSGANVDLPGYFSPLMHSVMNLEDANRKYDALLSAGASFADETEKQKAIEIFKKLRNNDEHLKRLISVPVNKRQSGSQWEDADLQ